MNNELTPKQQTSEAVRQAETILITTGQHPTVDQVAATLALTAILRKFGKKVSAIISDQLPQQAQFLDTSSLDKGLSGQRDFILKLDVTKSEVDKLRYEVEGGKLNVYITPFKGGFAPSDVTFDYGDFHYDLAIVLGVANRSRIDRVYGENQSLFNAMPLANIDFHRSNESYGAINLIEPTASSLCEILVALSESLQTGLIDADIATTMLAGLMSSTDRFTANHTTSKSLTVAAQMMAAGARQQYVVRGLYQGRPDRSERPERGSDRSDRNSDRTDRPDRSERGERNNDRGRERNADQSPRSAEHNLRANDQRETRPAPVVERTPTVSEPRLMPEPQQAASSRMAEPLLDPNHIEFSPMDESPAEVIEAPAQSVPMADFAAAAEILHQRNDGPQSIESVVTSDRNDDRPPTRA